MNTKEKVKKGYSETEPDPPRLPKNYICVDPTQKSLVFDFLKDFSEDIRESALMHLRLCLHCHEAATFILKINKYLEPKSGYYLHPAESEVAAEKTPCAATQGGDAELCSQTSEGDNEPDFFASNPSI